MDTIRNLYNNRVKKYGDDPNSVHWGKKERQELSFNAFIKNNNLNNNKILDIGCGLCDFYKYLKDNNIKVDYFGIDISDEMIKLSKKKYPELINKIIANDFNEINYKNNFDHIIISGIFNNNMGDNWEFIKKTLLNAYKISNKTVSFNLITDDVDYFDENLFYINPSKIVKYCNEEFSTNVKKIHDYNKYEYMIILSKEENDSISLGGGGFGVFWDAPGTPYGDLNENKKLLLNELKEFNFNLWQNIKNDINTNNKGEFYNETFLRDLIDEMKNSI